MPFTAPLLQLDLFVPQVPEDSDGHETDGKKGKNDKKGKAEPLEKPDFKFRKGHVQVNVVQFSGNVPVKFYLPKETPVSVVKEKIPKKLVAAKDCYFTDAP